MKEQKGITIVAMIITIIVMVILAGVAITTAVLDGGILQKTQNAQTEYEAGEELEKVKLIAAEAALAGAGTITEENLIEALDSNIGEEKYSLDSSNSEYFELTILDSGRKYMIYPNGKVEGPIMPDAPLGKAKINEITQTNSTIDGKAYSSTNPLIPAGFKAVNVGGKWDHENGPEVDKGLVIRDENDNEFVWVPVENEISTTEYVINGFNEPDVVKGGASYIPFDFDVQNLHRAGCTDKNNDGNLEASDFKIQLQEEYKKMAESINKYKGFYVGRYETSKNGSNPQSKRSQTASGSGTTIEVTIDDWYELYSLNKKYSTSSVTGSMMWGIQFNAIMQWTGIMSENIYNINKTNQTLKCGINSDDVKNNIFDLYGGATEYTMARENYYGRMYFKLNPTGPGVYKVTTSKIAPDSKNCGSRLILNIN